MLTNLITDHLSQLREQGLYRHRQFTRDTNAINFSSNDYLSLADDARLKKAYQLGFKRFPTGSGGSIVVSGYHAVHHALEQAFATALGVDDCMVFSSGYAANLSVTGLLGCLKASVLLDKGVHASIYDGLKLTGADYSRYLHNDLVDLAVKLTATSANTALITESLFSMSGQLAPLGEMVKLCRQHSSDLIVDEAHAFGILGREGLGAVIQQQLTQDDVPLRIIPFGKAYASCGAVVAGSGPWIDALLQYGRANTYSTAISPAFAYGLLETLDVVRGADERRAKLAELVVYFRQAIANSPFKWRDSHSPIQQLQLGCPHLALSFATTLREQSIICLPMRQPTVNKLETGLRVILNYHHQPEDIDYLFTTLLSLSPLWEKGLDRADEG